MTTTRTEAGIPKKLQVLQDSGGPVITWRWLGGRTVFLTLFAAFWDGFTLVFFRSWLESGAVWWAYLFPLVFIAVGVGVTCSALAGWLNRTRVRVAQDALTVTTRPLPFFNDRNIAPSELQRVYCREVVHRSRGGSYSTYEVRAVLRDGRNLKLIRGFDRFEPAGYLVDRIREILGIREEPAQGGN